jgi:hypothetical protein
MPVFLGLITPYRIRLYSYFIGSYLIKGLRVERQIVPQNLVPENVAPLERPEPLPRNHIMVLVAIIQARHENGVGTILIVQIDKKLKQILALFIQPPVLKRPVDFQVFNAKLQVRHLEFLPPNAASYFHLANVLSRGDNGMNDVHSLFHKRGQSSAASEFSVIWMR